MATLPLSQGLLPLHFIFLLYLLLATSPYPTKAFTCTTQGESPRAFPPDPHHCLKLAERVNTTDSFLGFQPTDPRVWSEQPIEEQHVIPLPFTVGYRTCKLEVKINQERAFYDIETPATVAQIVNDTATQCLFKLPPTGGRGIGAEDTVGKNEFLGVRVYGSYPFSDEEGNGTLPILGRPRNETQDTIYI